jgi:ankyrin repeat protein
MVITTAPRVTRSDDSTTGLMRAAAAGDEQRLHELLAAGAPLRCVDLWGRTALHWACEQGSERAVAALLAADAESATIEARDNAGNVPLARACYFGHEGAVRALLARGARQGLQGDRGWAALHCAAFKGHAGVVALLCAAPGAAEAMRLRTEGEDMVHLGLMGPAFTEGDSALGLALAHGRELCAEVLWASGARA